MKLNYKSLKNDFNNPHFFENIFSLRWDMLRQEKYALYSLLDVIKPKVSFEVGCFKGGSMQVLSHFSDKVITIDREFLIDEQDIKKFKNVEFCKGDSKVLIPRLVENCIENNDLINFVIIDGDHSEAGVRDDINLFLKYRPKDFTVIFMHDAFNPDCRSGIISADWNKYDYVKYVEIDFVPGNLFVNQENKNINGEMWGGVSIAILENESRDYELEIDQSYGAVYDACYKNSKYKKGIFNFF